MPGRTEYPHFIGLLFGIPLTGRPLPPEWAFAFHSLSAPMNYTLRYAYTKGQMVDEARQWLAEQAVEQNCRYLFFLGEDVTAPAHALRQLLFQMEHHPEAAVVGGIYCHKSQPPMPMVFRGNGVGPYWDWKVGELFEVSGIGMDCTVIRVDALKKLEKPWFKTVDDVSQFLEGRNAAEQWTEDLFFCQKVTQAGHTILADGGVLCDHWDMNTLTPVRLPSNCLPLRRAEHRNGAKKIVDLGCGENPLQTDEGKVLTVDIREDVKPDYRADLRWLPFATAEFDVVYSSHTLEHFARAETEAVLDEWIRILKPDGELRLVLPNLLWAAERLLAGKVDEDGGQRGQTEAWDVMNVLYGAQTYGANFHKMGFTPKLVEALLKKKGFRKMDFTLSGYNILVRAWRQAPGGKTEKKAEDLVTEVT